MKFYVYGCAVLVLFGMASQTLAAKQAGEGARMRPHSVAPFGEARAGLHELVREGLSVEQGSCVLDVREGLKDLRQPLREACGQSQVSGLACDEARVSLETAHASAREQILACLK